DSSGSPMGGMVVMPLLRGTALQQAKEESTMTQTIMAVDLAKTVFETAISEQPGRVADRYRVSRAQFLSRRAERQPATVVMEEGGSANHWARRLEALGHRVLWLPPHAVRPYVIRNKTDRTDAKGLLEAYRHDEIHPVPVKFLDQQPLSARHRLRSAWLAART